MYLSPLNYDRYFKKVFSDINIAKAFLMDFLDVEIETIEPLSSTHKLTDNATNVAFDFRCKIDGQYVIIDMQQWYKTDVVKRFYVYHAANSVLQLETLPFKKLLENVVEEDKRPRDYHFVEPVLTLVWMVDDTLRFTDDYVTFKMLPNTLLDFVNDSEIWTNPEISEILKKRANVLLDLNKKGKDLDFLQKNELVFLFQKNIVANKKYGKYAKWFEFAEKTRNKDNKKKDFSMYLKDETFIAMMRRLIADKEDIAYVLSAEQHQEERMRSLTSWRDEMWSTWAEDWQEEFGEAVEEKVEKRIEKRVTEKVEKAIAEKVEKEVTAKVEKEVTAKVEKEMNEKLEQEKQLKLDLEKQLNDAIKMAIKTGVLSDAQIATMFNVSLEKVIKERFIK